MTTSSTLLTNQAEAWGLTLSSTIVNRLEEYAGLLASYEKANVIGTRDREVILLEHVLDSLSCLVSGAFAHSSTVVDVGSGGGLPGIVLAIARPDLSVTLLEATGKKVSFLREVVKALSLTNVRLLEGRAEEFGHEQRVRESFDVAVAKAVAALPVVLEFCAPLVAVGGGIVAMKANLSEEERRAGERAAKSLGSRLSTTQQVEFLGALTQKERNLAMFAKVKLTPTRYPRRVGLPKKRPLG